MILTRDELSFLDVYCHEGTEAPFGGPATEAMARIGVYSGDTLNLQWAYLGDHPPTSPGIGKASEVVTLLAWPNGEAVLNRDAEIRALRERLPGLASRPHPRDEWERGLLEPAKDCGVSLPDSALSSEGLYD